MLELKVNCENVGEIEVALCMLQAAKEEKSVGSAPYVQQCGRATRVKGSIDAMTKAFIGVKVPDEVVTPAPPSSESKVGGFEEDLLEAVTECIGITTEQLKAPIAEVYSGRIKDIQPHHTSDEIKAVINSEITPEEVTITATIEDTTQSEITTQATIDLDADGVPWDARIHSSSQKKDRRDDIWCKKRNVDKNTPGLYERVTEELKAAMSAKPFDSEPTKPCGEGQPENLAQIIARDIISNIPPPAPTEPVTTPTALSTPTVPAELTEFKEFLSHVVPLQTRGVVTIDQIRKACVSRGLADVEMLSHREDMVNSVWQKLIEIAGLTVG